MENNFQETSSQGGNKSPRVWFWIIAIILASSFFGAVFGFMAGTVGRTVLEKNRFLSKFVSGISDDRELPPQIEKIVEEDSVVTSMVEKVSPSVVSIVITRDVPLYRDMDIFDFFNRQIPDGDETEKQRVGSGSGFLVTENGLIVTNKHVVEDTRAEYTVVMNDGKEYPADVVARDPVQDIAIIKIEGSGFPIMALGDSDQMKIGQTVVAIGNSLGEFSNSVSKGIISGLQRSLTAGSASGRSEQLTNIIQTDAAINPGNSGGPLLNINGEVIGVNVAVAQGAENVGFAIPVNQFKRIITQVKDTGKISSPFLGVRYVIVDEELKEANNLDFDYGAIVVRGEKISDLAVVPGSPADKAGIVENDIILEIDGEKIDAKNPVANIISNYDIGEEITLKVWHRGEMREVKTRLEERK